MSETRAKYGVALAVFYTSRETVASIMQGLESHRLLSANPHHDLPGIARDLATK